MEAEYSKNESHLDQLQQNELKGKAQTLSFRYSDNVLFGRLLIEYISVDIL